MPLCDLNIDKVKQQYISYAGRKSKKQIKKITGWFILTS